MRVLLTTDAIGGVWTFTRELSQQLIRVGHCVHLVSFGRSLSVAQTDWCSKTEVFAGGAFSWEASDAPLEWMPQNERTWVEGRAVLAAAVHAFAPDILHSNQFCFGAMGESIPRIVTAHSDVLSWAEACRPAGLGASAWLDRYRNLVSIGLRGAHTVAAPTMWMAEALARNWNLREPVQVIMNGRSIEASLPREAPALQALSAGRMWDEAKGLSTLLERDWPVPMFVAGEESFEGSATFRAAHVHALGALNEEELFAAMRRSAIYVAPSIYEPFGLAPLEAALCGCALVLRELPSFREVWGSSALYFSSADELVARLGDLSSNEKLLYTMRRAAVQHANKYDASSMANSYLRLYEEAVQGSGMHAMVQMSSWESDAA